LAAVPPGWDFEVLVLRFRLAPEAELRFGSAGAANDFRGALGYHLPEPVFRPRQETGPSGLKDAPRPFVLRARHLDGRTLARGEAFGLRIHLFSRGDQATIVAAMEAACREGLGPDRIPLSVLQVAEETLKFDLSQRSAAPPFLLVRFLTAVELKGWDGKPPLPFPVLIARLRDRLSILRAVYGSGPIPFDFQGLAQRAQSVRCFGCALTHTRSERISRRTGERHPLGGFLGACVYEGDFREFLPLLEAGVYTGVGRQTVWGKGEYFLTGAGSPEEIRKLLQAAPRSAASPESSQSREARRSPL
jgi:hypothetical protein